VIGVTRQASRKKRESVKSNFRQFGFRLVLFLWFTLAGIKSDADEAAGSASASVVSPISVNRALLDLEGVAFISEVTGSRRIIGIARALPRQASVALMQLGISLSSTIAVLRTLPWPTLPNALPTRGR
jgi:hypothetical protein